MHSASDTGVAMLLQDVLSRMREVLGEALVGLYLYGSLVGRDFDHDISDIDLLAVTASDADAGGFRALARMHDTFTREHPAWEDRLDIVYISVDALRTFGRQASTIAVISPGEPFHRKEAIEDWLVNWYLVREHGRTLFGPPPVTFIRPIAKDEFVQVVRVLAQHWSAWISQMHTRKAQAYAVLTLCRALYVHQNGEQVSKQQAAVWAIRELPQWSSLIQNALLWRRKWRDDGVVHAATLPETRRFVQSVIERVAAG